MIAGAPSTKGIVLLTMDNTFARLLHVSGYSLTSKSLREYFVFPVLLKDIYLIIIAGFGKRSIHRRLAGESSNLAAVPTHSAKPQSDAPVRLRRGAFPALAKESSASIMQSPAQSSQEFPKVEERPKRNGLTIILVIVGSNTALVIILCLAFIFFRRYQGAKKVWAKDAALLHRLSKAFVTGLSLVCPCPTTCTYFI